MCTLTLSPLMSRCRAPLYDSWSWFSIPLFWRCWVPSYWWSTILTVCRPHPCKQCHHRCVEDHLVCSHWSPCGAPVLSVQDREWWTPNLRLCCFLPEKGHMIRAWEGYGVWLIRPNQEVNKCLRHHFQTFPFLPWSFQTKPRPAVFPIVCFWGSKTQQ